MIYLTYNIPYNLYLGSLKEAETNAILNYCKSADIPCKVASPWDGFCNESSPTAFINMNGWANTNHQRLARRYELQGSKYLNSIRDTIIADDKFSCYLELTHNEIPMPKTMDLNQLFGISGNAKRQFTTRVSDYIGFPCVVKVSNGGQGNGIYLLNNSNEFEDWYNMLAWTNPKFGYNETGVNFVVQKFIAKSYGKALRVYILDDHCLGTIYRENLDHWKVNRILDGSSIARIYDDNNGVVEMCKKALRVLNLRFGACDVLFNDNEFLINEVNSSPGFIIPNKECIVTLYPDMNLPKMIIDALLV